ncbi:MAG: hypothetical protein V1726_05325 [Methanobacteriota archaeon]
MRKILAVGSILLVSILILTSYSSVVEARNIPDNRNQINDIRDLLRNLIDFLEYLFGIIPLFIFGLLWILSGFRGPIV